MLEIQFQSVTDLFLKRYLNDENKGCIIDTQFSSLQEIDMIKSQTLMIENMCLIQSRKFMVKHGIIMFTFINR
jgi:hypothetical protein